MKKSSLLFWACSGLLASVCWAGTQAVIDVNALMKLADLARGGGDITGLVWQVEMHSSGSGMESQADQRLLVRANQTASLVEVLQPQNAKGSKMLQVEGNMWLSKPGLKKPVAISPRQRFSGQAAIGDVAATNYAKDYSATLLGSESCAGQPCYRIELKSINSQSTYSRIDYWVDINRGVAVRANFLSLNGKPLKMATFSYQNKILVNGKTIPFIDEMKIQDALTDARTSLKYTQIKIQEFPLGLFNVMNLQ